MSAVKLSSLPVGALLDVEVKPEWQSRFGSIITWRVADQGHEGYPAGCTTLITDKIIQLMCFDAKEPNNSTLKRREYGNNYYLASNIHQWLNSTAMAGQWYSKQHGGDAPPTKDNLYDGYNSYDQWAGFLAMLPDDFCARLLDTGLTVIRPSLEGSGSETITAKMFLASATEVGFESIPGIDEGPKFAHWDDDISRLAYPTSHAVSSSNWISAEFSVSKSWHWMLRTPLQGTQNSYRYVSVGGIAGSSSAARDIIGVRPLCNLPGDTDVTQSVTGNYVITVNLTSAGKGRFQAALGGVLRPTSAPMPVIGGVRRMPTALRANIGGVLRDVWPGLPAPGRVLEAYSWDEIAQVAAAGKAASYWQVGDTKFVTLNGGNYHMQIIGFDHDDLAASDAMYGTGYNGGSNKAGITFCLMTCFDATKRMNPSETNVGGWDTTEMRTTTLANTFYGYLATDLKNTIRTVNKLAAKGGQSLTILTSADKLWLLSEIEVFGFTSNSKVVEGSQYSYWSAGQSKLKFLAGDSHSWWLRSAHASYSTNFLSVDSGGGIGGIRANSPNGGVAFGLCI